MHACIYIKFLKTKNKFHEIKKINICFNTIEKQLVYTVDLIIHAETTQLFCNQADECT